MTVLLARPHVPLGRCVASAPLIVRSPLGARLARYPPRGASAKGGSMKLSVSVSSAGLRSFSAAPRARSTSCRGSTPQALGKGYGAERRRIEADITIQRDLRQGGGASGPRSSDARRRTRSSAAPGGHTRSSTAEARGVDCGTNRSPAGRRRASGGLVVKPGSTKGTLKGPHKAKPESAARSTIAPSREAHRAKEPLA